MTDALRKAKAAEHVCLPDRTCTCSMVGGEPDERCPRHGWPERWTCGCGRFVANPLRLTERAKEGR